MITDNTTPPAENIAPTPEAPATPEVNKKALKAVQAVEQVKQLFVFTEYDIKIEAGSYEEAQDLLKQQLEK
ncbi:MAG: hypothetical protein WCJ84_00430 [Candidatus Peregrinibacteria bacterium]